MKIVKNNYNNQEPTKYEEKELFPIELECEECGSELIVDKEDTYIGWLGERFFKCPCCEGEVMIDGVDGIKLTKDNLKFPQHFSRTKQDERNCVHITNEEIEEYIKNGINHLRNSNDDTYMFQSGDLYMHIDKLDGDEEYYIVVTQDSYSTYIPFEKEDYKEMD